MANVNDRICIIGGGPAGLSAAYYLRLAGHSVTIYDAMPEMGGMLRYGIPEYRLPKSVLAKEIKAIEKLGVLMKNNVSIGKDISFEEIRKNSDAVLIAIGAWKGSSIRCPGEELEGVLSGIDFLREVNLGKCPDIGKNVAVVGGGNVAMDAARTALRLGAETTIVYRRTEKELPARAEEVHHAKEEGITFMTATNPVRFVGENNAVCGVEAVKMEIGEPGEDGRSSIKEIAGSNFVVEADVVVEAIGQGPNPLLLRMMPDLARNRNGSVTVNEVGQTSIAKVYAGGDVATGAATVILAMGTAKDAARAIDAKLRE